MEVWMRREDLVSSTHWSVPTSSANTITSPLKGRLTYCDQNKIQPSCTGESHLQKKRTIVNTGENPDMDLCLPLPKFVCSEYQEL
jgi:hypothetical protein